MTQVTFALRNATIPQALKDRRHWSRWTKGTRDKMPANLDNSAMKWGDPTNWLAFDQVSRFEKIGIILEPKETGIIPIDFDGCMDKETGIIHPLVMRWIQHTYAEVSPSRTGIKAYIRGTLPSYIKEIDVQDVPWRISPEQQHVGIEVYGTRHFLTITGDIVPGCPSEINEPPEVLNEILVHFAPAPKVRETKPKGETVSENWDFDAWVRRYLDVNEVLDDGYIITCPWADEHSTPGDTARIWEGPPHTFSCFHAHCKGCEWRDVREYFEPDAYTRKNDFQTYKPEKDTTSNKSNGHKPASTSVTGEDLCKFDPDDSGNGDAMFALFGQDFLWCGSIGWFNHTKTHWQVDADGAEVKKRAVETLRMRRHAAVDAEKEAIVKCTKADDGRVNGCVSRFKTLVSVRIDAFDSNPDLLNCQNGVVDLRTGQVEPHNRSQRFTYCLPVAYDEADYTEWLDYLNGVVGGGQEVIDYLQMALGYSLTGHTREEILFYLFGPTRSGKGTLAETFMTLLPRPISTMVDFNSFTAKREGDVSNFDLAPLKPSRMIFASESNRSQSLNPAKIKQLTGGDYITACFKHKDFFSYHPQFKVWMLSNWPVNGDPEDDALWGRVRVIEFPNSFLGREDKTKKARLKDQDVLQGILYWAVQGSINWYALGAKGLSTPDVIANTTKAQRAELDYIQQWLEESCDNDDEGWVSNEDVMASYSAWCKNNNVQYPKGPKALAQSLKTKGYEPGQVRWINGKSKRGVSGLYIYRPDPPTPE